jgi:hypothetical protein
LLRCTSEDSLLALRYTLALFLVSGLHAGCSPQSSPPQQKLDDVDLDGVEADSTSFANRVWRVERSASVEPKTLYVFLSDGSLVITSDHGTPLLGTWKYEDGTLTMIEEGLPYDVDILELSGDRFRIRSNNPGEPVEIEFIAAKAD